MVATATELRSEGALAGMEEVLVDNLDDLCLHRAYASAHLLSRDPIWAARGRYIEAQLRLEEHTCPEVERKKLEAKKRKLLREFARPWLGDLSCYLLEQDGWTFELWRGWLDTVRVPELRGDFLLALARSPRARLLRRLEIDGVTPDGPRALKKICDAPWISGLREFRLGAMIQRDRPAEFIRQLADEAA